MRYIRVGMIAMVAGAAAGCATTPDSYEQRMQDTYAYIESWESALAGSADDRGWSMLSGNAQAGFEDEGQYVALAEAADWSRFELTPVNGHCDDLYACSIGVVVSRNPAATPEFLVRSPLDEDGKRFSLLVIVDEDEDGAADVPEDDLGNGFVSVWWERVPWPDPGIGGSGG